MKKILSGLLFLSLAFCLQAQEKSTVRFMTYNIRNAKGMDEITDYRRIAGVIENLSPETLALQEIDSVTKRSNGVDVLAEIAAQTGMFCVYGAAIDFDGGKYGVGILSKKQAVATGRVPLPGREEARLLLIAEFEDYVFFCTHFSLNREDRLASVEIIDAEAKKYGKPVLLAGDLNARPDSQEISKLEENWLCLTDKQNFTFSSEKPNKTIDYIFVYKTKPFKAIRSAVLNGTLASDHLPVWVDVDKKP